MQLSPGKHSVCFQTYLSREAREPPGLHLPDSAKGQPKVRENLSTSGRAHHPLQLPAQKTNTPPHQEWLRPPFPYLYGKDKAVLGTEEHLSLQLSRETLRQIQTVQHIPLRNCWQARGSQGARGGIIKHWQQKQHTPDKARKYGGSGVDQGQVFELHRRR